MSDFGVAADGSVAVLEAATSSDEVLADKDLRVPDFVRGPLAGAAASSSSDSEDDAELVCVAWVLVSAACRDDGRGEGGAVWREAGSAVEVGAAESAEFAPMRAVVSEPVSA